MIKNIVVKGAREHNLKNVNLTLPREKLIVMTGLSGSGKSSLAFDTIFADGQRRYMESLSSYARMFLGQMEKPDVDEITGLSPAVSIDQKTTSHNPRSTVGTVTEIYDYLRLMYARIGVPHCPVCGRVISQQTVDEMVDEVLKLPERTRFQVLAPVVRGRKGTQAKELDAARRGGYARVRIDGNMYDLDEEIKLEKNKKHSIPSHVTPKHCPLSLFALKLHNLFAGHTKVVHTKAHIAPAQCKARKLCDVKAPQQSKCPAYNSHNTAP